MKREEDNRAIGVMRYARKYILMEYRYNNENPLVDNDKISVKGYLLGAKDVEKSALVSKNTEVSLIISEREKLIIERKARRFFRASGLIKVVFSD